VRVQDNGPGIPPKHLPRLFDRFYRVDQARHAQDDVSQPGGSGLGLAIAQWIAQAHGGRIDARSQVGQGATFEVWLPSS
jgi:signal transduction histidine kinase